MRNSLGEWVDDDAYYLRGDGPHSVVTLRDHFAIRAPAPTEDQLRFRSEPEIRYAWADAMLALRAKQHFEHDQKEYARA